MNIKEEGDLMLACGAGGFSVFGSIVELFSLGSTRRIMGVLAAMLSLSFIHIWGMGL